MRKFGKILVALILMLGLGLLVGCGETKLEGIEVTPASLTLEMSQIEELEVKPVPAEAVLPTVEFASSDSRIASVGKDGKVMGLRAGTAEITVTAGEFTKKVTITVNPVMPTSLTLSKEAVTLKVGEKATITYKVAPQDTTDQVAQFASNNEAIATVSAEGEITAVAEGEAVITVSLGGLEKEVAVTVNPGDVLPSSVRIKPLESNELAVGATVQLEGFILPADALQDTFVWASNNEEIATVSAEGLVAAVAAGEVEISLSLKNYPDVPAAKITLNCYLPLPERLRMAGPDKIVVIEGELYEYTVSFVPEGSYTEVTWSVDDETKGTIDPDTGKVTALAAGPLTITATSKALAALKVSKMVIVEAYVAPEVTVEGKASLGKALPAIPYKATVKGNYLGPNVTWSVSDPAILSVDAAGNLTGLAAGTANVIAASVDDPEIKGMMEVTVIDVGENINVLIKAGIEADGGTTEYDGVTYYNGINALPNLTDIGPLLRDGSKVYVLAGEYESLPIVVSAKNVSFIGPNAGISAVDGERVEEAKISGKITLNKADNFLIDGFHLVGKSPIRSTTGLNKLTVKNNHFDYVNAEGGGAEGVIFLNAATDAIEYHNVVLEGNLFEEASTGGPGFRGLRARNVVNLKVLNNKLIGFFEPIRVESTGGVGTWSSGNSRANEGSGAGLGGVVLIQGNITENVGEYPLFFGRVTADKFDILDNTIMLNAASPYSYGTMMFTNIQKGPEGVQRVYNIKYNNFMFSGDWHGLRIDSSECLKENLIIDIQWNKWLTEHNFYPSSTDEDGLGNFHEDYVISRYYAGYEPENPADYPIYVANNFYQSKPEDYMFTRVRRDKASYFLNEAEFDYYRGLQLGAPAELKLFYDADEVVEGQTLQLKASKRDAVYASSDPSIATVNKKGLVTGIAPGEVNIKVTSGRLEAVLALTVLPIADWDETIGLVDPNIEGQKGDPVVQGELTYHIGYNAFTDLELMMAAAQPAQTITVNPGSYEKVIEVKVAGLTLVGPLADKDPTLEADRADFKDPEKAAMIKEQIHVLADNVTIKGFSFGGGARVQFFKQQENFVFEGNYVENPVYTKPARLFKETWFGTNEHAAENSGPGFIHGGGNALNDKMINFRIQKNYFKDIADTVVYLCMHIGLEFHDNVLDTYDGVGLWLDWGTTNGTFNIKGNTFKNGELFGFYSRGYGAAPGSIMNIENNVFDNVGNNAKAAFDASTLSRVSLSAIAVRNYRETGDATFKIEGNDFLGCAMALSMRNNYASTIAFTFTSEVKYNAFINTEAPEFYQRTRYATDTEASNPNDTLFDYNFFGKSETEKVVPTAAQLQGAKEGSNENNYDSYEALVAGRRGEVIPVAPEVILEGPEMILGLNNPTQYNATVKGDGLGNEVIWSVSDENILSVDEAGKVTGLAAGSANVIAKSKDNPEISAQLAVVVVDTKTLLVDASITAETESLEYKGVKYYKGHNLFADIPSSLAAVEDGTVINVAPGEYPEVADKPIVIAKENVSLIGPNAGINAADGEARGPEAVLKARIQLENAHNFVMDGFKLAEAAPIRSSTGLNKLTLKNLFFDFVKSVSGGEGVVYLAAPNVATEYKDILVEQCLFSAETHDQGPSFRGLRLNNAINVQIVRNKFVGYLDPVRIASTSGAGFWNADPNNANAGSGAGLGGEALIAYNTFEDVAQYPIYIGRATASKLDIVHNTIKPKKDSPNSYGTVMLTHIIPAEGEKYIYNIKFNDIMFPGDWHSLRIDSSGCTKDNLEVNVEWNKWLDEHNFYPSSTNEDGEGNFHEDYVISRFYTGKTPADPAQYPIYVANNFYQTKPEDYMFTRVRRDATKAWFGADQEAAFDAARLAAQPAA